MILQNWGLGQGPYPVKFRIKALSPADDDLRIKIDGNVVENTLLNVSFYSGSTILPSGTLNNLWQTQGFREIEISASQAISKGSSWSFNSFVEVDVSNTGDAFQTGPGQWRSPVWTASIYFSDGRIVYKHGGRNDPGLSETASLSNPVYHENGNFYLNFDVPTTYSDLIVYSFDSSSLNPSYQAQDFSGSTFITGSTTSSFFTGSITNIGGSNSFPPMLSIRGYTPTQSINVYGGFNFTNLTGQTYNLKTFEFDMGVGSGNLILEGFYSLNNFITSSSFFQMLPTSITQCMHFSYALDKYIHDGQKIEIRIVPKSQTGTTGTFRIDNLKITGYLSNDEQEQNIGDWGSGEGTPIDGLSLVVLTVANTNSILDDGWDFKIDGTSVANYDGGGDTTLTFHSYYQPGETHSLSAECVFEQSDNYFEVYIDVNGERQITTSVEGDGTIGEIQELGTFTT